MCGLLSFLGPAAGDAERLARGLAALGKRGPDDRQTWVSPRGDVALGHNRLAIVDPGRGRHPVTNEDGMIRAIVNGEFYGHPLLRAELQGRGHRFESGSDSEILVHLYEEMGVGALERLRGEFAFLLWDEKQGRLWAVRDRFGVKPLVFARIGTEWCFASHAKALFAAGHPARWDEDAFYHAASTQYPPPGRTLFADVRQMPPGHFALICAGDSKVVTYRYWDPPRHEPEVHFELDDFGHALDEAVRLRLPASGQCAFQLSGGIDSASVLALAHQTLPTLDAFTVSFENPQYDELGLAREVAELYGANLEAVRLGSEDLLASLEPAVYASEGLAVNAHLAGKYRLAQRVAERGFKVVLTGEGADEILLGYPHFRQDLEGRLDPELLASNQASAGIMLSGGPTLSLRGVKDTLGWVPSFLQAKGALGYRLHQVLAPSFLDGHAHRDPFLESLACADLAGRSRLDQASYLWCKSALQSYILLTLGDGCEMAHSIEGRVPFLDHRFVELVARLPQDWKIRGGVEKWLLREAMRPLLPPRIVGRRKHPFMAPPLGTCQGELLRVAREVPLAYCDVTRLERKMAEVSQLPVLERHEWEPVWMWLLTAHYLQKTLGLR